MSNKTNCASCGKRINTNATMCPKCRGAAKVVAEPVDKKAERKGTLWAYITGTLFILTGLGAFQISLLSALMLTFGGILALPFVRVGLVKISGFSTDKFLVIASAVLIIFGVIGYTSSVKNERLESMDSDTTINE